MPRDVHEVGRFLGLSFLLQEIYSCLCEDSSPLACPDPEECCVRLDEQLPKAFEALKERLTTAPVLAYPRFDRPFQLETDASGLGVGAVLSQVQKDGKSHPIAFASCALSPCERNYGITELETLAVVRSVSHFRNYLYGQDVAIYTDHTAVTAVLQKPNASAKHTRWWLKVHGSGLKNVTIRYRPGRENSSADALFRGPVGAVPPDETTALPMAVAQINTTEDEEDVSLLLNREPVKDPLNDDRLIEEQRMASTDGGILGEWSVARRREAVTNSGCQIKSVRAGRRSDLFPGPQAQQGASRSTFTSQGGGDAERTWWSLFWTLLREPVIQGSCLIVLVGRNVHRLSQPLQGLSSVLYCPRRREATETTTSTNSGQ